MEATEKTKPDEVDGMVPLQYAVEYGQLEVFQFLYKNSENKDPKGRNGYSLLHHAADKGRFEIVDEILKKKMLRSRFLEIILEEQHFILLQEKGI